MTPETETPLTASTSPNPVLDVVKDRYAEGAQNVVPELCCPVDYDASLLEVLPDEIIDRDYGCGDPSRFVREGEVVLDLGSGAGKICYMASQIVGEKGKVIGVDTTPEMLSLAREHQSSVGDAIGWHNVEFKRGHIQDLALDHDELETWLKDHPVADVTALENLEAEKARLRSQSTMIASDSIDVVLSNCVLNLVDSGDKPRMFREIHRVLKRGGRAVISDIVSDEDVPLELQRNPELWSGCISGAMREDRFMDAFAEAGLYGIEIAVYQSEPWAIVEGIEFRSMTVIAHKGKEGACYDHGEAVIYKGPWKSVTDDDGHTLHRGQRMAVCRKTLGLYSSEPYADQFVPVQPLTEIAEGKAPLFDCNQDGFRSPAETKFGAERADVAPGTSCCDPVEGSDACC